MSISPTNNSYVSTWYSTQTRTSTEKPEEDKDTSTDSTEESETKPNPDSGGSILGKPEKPWFDKDFGDTSMEGVNVSTSNKNPYAPPSNHLNSISTLVTQTIGALGLEGKSVSYNELLEYRDSLTEIFSAKVKTGLKTAGVAEDADFRLSLESDGTFKVHSNHKDKAKIEKFFKDNPKLTEDYKTIESLNQLENMRSTHSVDMNTAYNQARMLSMSMSMGGGGNAAMAMTGGGLASHLMGGINTTV